MTASLDLTASRNLAWAPTIDLFYPGAELPLDGATIKMEVRLYPGQPGSPLIVGESLAFQDLPPSAPGGQRCLRVFPGANQDALAAMPTGLNQPEPGEADVYAYDIILTYADGQQDKLALGRFIVEPGVTQP
ncbi:hypothetical protein [Sphingobium sp. DC-2]|uniref:hypothetical protein n=1 Tax=Sphingobium sp. DC-2 TaxID=1303256 RepID=UPI0004C3111D|nr:hypothetical protein [Sphingobium sp. DC-2]